MSRRLAMGRVTAFVAAAVSALALQAGTAAPASAYKSTATCASVVQLVVRGSGEAAGSGQVGNIYTSGGQGRMAGVASSVASGTSRSVRTAGLAYPATIGWGGFSYLSSLNTGRDRLAAELRRLTSLCSSTRFVLIGYSQGAHVIGDVMSNSNPEGLSSTVRGRVVAIFNTGDPVRRYGESYNRGTGLGGGVLIDRGAGQMSGMGTRIRSYCYKGDYVCDYDHRASYNTAMAIHGSYGNSSIRTYGSNFILSRL